MLIDNSSKYAPDLTKPYRDFAEELICEVDIRAINGRGSVPQFNYPVPIHYNNASLEYKVIKKSGFFTSEKRSHDPVIQQGSKTDMFIKGVRNYLPAGISYDVELVKRNSFGSASTSYAGFGTIRLIVRVSPAYAMERCRLHDPAEFENRLRTARASEIQQIAARIKKTSYVSNEIFPDRIIETDGESGYTLLRYSDIGLVDLDSFAQRYALANVLADILNRQYNGSTGSYRVKFDKSLPRLDAGISLTVFVEYCYDYTNDQRQNNGPLSAW